MSKRKCGEIGGKLYAKSPISGNIASDEFVKACRDGDLKFVQMAIQRTLEYYAIAFHEACRKGHLDIVKELINQRIDIEKPDISGRTPFYIACRWGHTNVVRELIAQHVDIETPDHIGRSPFHTACENGHLEIVKELIAQHVDIEKPDNNGLTPFYLACVFGHIQVIRELSSIVKMAEIKRELFISNSNEIQSILIERIQKEYHVAVIHLLFGQKQPDSSLSMLHRDVLQDISKTIKEKLFL